MDSEPPTVRYEPDRLDLVEMRKRADSFLASMRKRRSVRHFARRALDLDVVRNCIATAAQAPSGANKQPWTFVLVTCPETKRRIREAAEEEERAFYEGRATSAWLSDLEPLGTDWRKPFIEDAPALVVVFAQRHAPTGSRHYYVAESVGIAVGFLIAALHHSGLSTLTHTPSPMSFLAEVLERPANERAYMLLPVGFAAPDCRVPAIERKALSDVLVEFTDGE